jgi:hypothetical protein
VKTRAQRDKDRRLSRGPAKIRRDFDIHNAVRRIASQRSQSTELGIPMYHPDPAPNISSSSSLLSSSSSSAVNNNDHINDGNDDNRSECDSPGKQRTRFGVSPDDSASLMNGNNAKSLTDMSLMR